MIDTYRVRFRFRLQRFLNIPSAKYSLEVAGREAVLSSMTDSNISDSSWLVMNVRGFENNQEATAFAARLKAACEFSSVAARLGMDAGVDLPTSSFSSFVKESIRQESGISLRNNVHGIDVFVDGPNVRIGIIEASGRGLVAPDPFLADLTGFYEQVGGASQTTRDIVLLLNYALMRPDPVAQIVFAFSVVEMLGQCDWSSDQKLLLDRLAISEGQSDLAPLDERSEVVYAIKRGMHRVSLRQGVLRLLVRLPPRVRQPVKA